MKLEPIEKDIIFAFHDHVTSAGFFKEKSQGGIIIAQSNVSSAQESDQARIGTIVAAGPGCESFLTEGVKILIEPLKWTPQFEVDGKSYWKTNEQFVLGVVED